MPAAHRHHHVLEGSERRHQVETLEHDADGPAPILGERAAAQADDLCAGDFDRARSGREDCGQHRKQRRLAAPGHAEEQHELTARRVEREPVDRTNRIPTRRVLDDKVADLEVGVHDSCHPNANAGSTVTARLSATSEENRPIRIATIGKAIYVDIGTSTRIGITGARMSERIERGERGREREHGCLHGETPQERARRDSHCFEYGEVTRTFDGLQVQNRPNDSGGDEPQQNGDEADRRCRALDRPGEVTLHLRPGQTRRNPWVATSPVPATRSRWRASRRRTHHFERRRSTHTPLAYRRNR